MLFEQLLPEFIKVEIGEIVDRLQKVLEARISGTL
jgi:hypothetical protein